ncbi:hypothetical protein [Pseudophaeobacter sp. TrK17]|uniref:hypothetical protein n=1 Tax=Pseudophaeobacter sp. TrK17 TaxID=2815167 RepID=UPI0035CF4357
MTKILLLMALMVLPLLTLQSMRLGHEVVQRLEGLSTAATDNMQWVLSQAEVDHLKLEAALDAAEEPGGITALRRQFDVYYSRIATFVEGPLFADSVEKQRAASAEIGVLICARVPFLSGFSRLLRCRKDLGQFSEVLGGSGEEEFVICAARPA